MSTMQLNLVFKLIDQATAPIRRIGQITAGLQRPFKAAQMAAGGLLHELRGIALAGAAVGAALGAALYRSVRSTADIGDAALETSQKLGVSVPALMRWGHAAKQSGVEAGSLEDSLKFLSISSAAAADGSKQDQAAFARLGVAFRDAHGNLLPLEQLLPKVADAFQNMEAGPRKAQIAAALFGRSGGDMIPMLNEGAAGMKKWGDQAEQLGLVMTQLEAEQADAFNDSLGTLKGSITGLGRSITVNLLPQLTGLITSLTAMIAANKPEILRRTKEIFGQISAALPGVIKGVSDFAKFLGDIAAVVGPVVETLGGFNGVLDLMAVLMITRVAVAVWSAVAAVWGLNGAMLANPIGIVIVLIAALAMAVYGVIRNWKQISTFFKGVWVVLRAVFSVGIKAVVGFLLNFTPQGLIIKHWASITGFFSRMWAGVKTVFRAGADAVWNALPAWFRQVLRGIGFAVRIATGGVGSQPAGGGDVAGGRAPRPAVGASAAGGRWSGDVGIRLFDDRRAPLIETRSSSPDFTLAAVGGVQTRGGG